MRQSQDSKRLIGPCNIVTYAVHHTLYNEE